MQTRELWIAVQEDTQHRVEGRGEGTRAGGTQTTKQPAGPVLQHVHRRGATKAARHGNAELEYVVSGLLWAPHRVRTVHGTAPAD